MSYIKWTNELKEKFIKMYPSCSIEELQKEFPVSEKTIKKIASSLKVKRENTRNSNYTSREDEILLCGINIESVREKIMKSRLLKYIHETPDELTASKYINV